MQVGPGPLGPTARYGPGYQERWLGQHSVKCKLIENLFIYYLTDIKFKKYC